MAQPTYWSPESPAEKYDDAEFREAHFDPQSHELTRGRFLRVAGELRDNCPVAHSDAHEEGFWSITRYHDLETVHQDPVSFSTHPISMPRIGNPRPMIPVEADPPLHRGYRRILTDQFSRPSQNAKVETYRAFAVECIDTFLDRGECDLAAELCTPLALRAFADAFGVPDDRQGEMEDIALRVVRLSQEDGGTEQTVQDLYAFSSELIELRREEPRDDVLTRLTQAELDGKPLTETEILDYCMVLLPAGFETTASSMAYMFLLLCENPGIQERLSADHDLIPAALEEMMRYVTPVRSMARTVMADVEINGCPMRRGDRLHMNHVAGNHDPEVFENPEEIIIDRRPNRHLGFGMGPHMCLGIHMARAEMRVAFEETLSRMKSLRLADPDLVKEEPGATWSIASLPIEFDRVEAV